jgi:putative YhbY family RNA-binding protein
MMKPLTPPQRRALKARAHPLSPVVIVGEAGLTPAVLQEIEVHLKSHELIKIRAAAGDRAAREALGDAVCRALGASPVQHIGKVLVLYRERPAQHAAARGRRPPRRTKRSYQNPR